MTVVDPKAAFYGYRSVSKERTALQAVRDAYNQAVTRCQERGREAVFVEVVIRVAPLTGKGKPAAGPSR